MLDSDEPRATTSGLAPHLFRAGKDDVTILDETPPDEQRARAELAVEYCPTRALSIVEEDVNP